jgi:hypothetical protein
MVDVKKNYLFPISLAKNGRNFGGTGLIPATYLLSTNTRHTFDRIYRLTPFTGIGSFASNNHRRSTRIVASCSMSSTGHTNNEDEYLFFDTLVPEVQLAVQGLRGVEVQVADIQKEFQKEILALEAKVRII